MAASNIFLNDAGQVRSGWRVAAFTVAFIVCAKIFEAALSVIISLSGRSRAAVLYQSSFSFVVGALVLLVSATIIGWGCGWIFEQLPFRSLGWSQHPGWFKNFIAGSAIGAASLLLAAGFAAVTRGIRFTLDPASATTIGRTAIVSAIVFVVAGAGEEALFRGYPLQTFARARLAWVGIVLTSLPFAAAHLYNPHANRTFTFLNTAVAGV